MSISVKNSTLFKLMVPAALFGIAMSMPVYAQDNNASAGPSMQTAGEKMAQAGSEGVDAAVDAYQAAVRFAQDIAVTAAVKTALLTDRSFTGSQIHVTTTAGIVTLEGRVESNAVLAHAQQVASQTRGVNGVNNQLTVSDTTSTD